MLRHAHFDMKGGERTFAAVCVEVCYGDKRAIPPHATTRKMYETAARLYEQKGHRTKPTPLGQYLTRWNAWFRSGLSGIELRGAFLPALESGTARSVQHP